MRKHHFIWTQVTDKPLRAGERLICRDFYCPPLLNRDTPLCLHSSLRCNLCHFLHLLRQTLLHSCWLPRVHGFDLWKITSTSRHPWAWPPSNVPLPHEFVKCCCCQSPWFCYCSRAPCCYPCQLDYAAQALNQVAWEQKPSLFKWERAWTGENGVEQPYVLHDMKKICIDGILSELLIFHHAVATWSGDCNCRQDVSREQGMSHVH